MDAQYRISEIVKQRRPPKIREMADIAEAIAIPVAIKQGFIYESQAEDLIRNELFNNGFSMSFFDSSTSQKANYRFETIMRFAMIALKGEGRHCPRTNPVIEDHPDYKDKRTKHALYVPRKQENVKQNLSNDEKQIIAYEGPDNTRKSHQFYNRSSRLRSLILYYKSEPVCEYCNTDLRSTYGESAWKALDVHHEVPIGQRESIEETKWEDVKLVCCCCHAVLHRAGSKD